MRIAPVCLNNFFNSLNITSSLESAKNKVSELFLQIANCFVANKIADTNYSALDILSKFSWFKEDISKITNKIEQLVVDKNRLKLHKLAYRLLSDRPDIYEFDYRRVLSSLLYDSQSDLRDVADLIICAYIDSQSEKSIEQRKEEEACTSAGIKEFKRLYTHEDDNSLIEIAHGGGYWFLRDFFKNRHEGYRLESNQGLGIQVHPLNHKSDCDRSNSYTDKALYYLDKPALLTATLPGKYLRKFPVSFEAGLNHRDREHVKNIKIVECKVKYVGSVLNQKDLCELKTKFSKEQLKRIKESTIRMGGEIRDDQSFFSRLSLIFKKCYPF